MHGAKFLSVIASALLLSQASPALALSLPGTGTGTGTADPVTDDKNYNNEESRKGFKPGANGNYAWSNQEPKACVEAKKPVVVYIYDDAMKTHNHTAWFFEKQVFPDLKVQRALKDYTFVMAPRSAAAWSNYFLTKAEEGAAVFLLTYDGTVHACWMKGMRPMPEEFAAQATIVSKSNPYALERARLDVVTEIDYSKLKQVGPRPEDPAARKEVVARLADGIAAWLKAGEQPKVWLALLSKSREELPVLSASQKALTVSVKNNPMTLRWDKMNGEDLLSVAKSVMAEKPERLLLAAEVALAVGYVEQAVDLLAIARLGSPELKAKALALVAKINPSAAAAAVAVAVPAGVIKETKPAPAKPAEEPVPPEKPAAVPAPAPAPNLAAAPQEVPHRPAEKAPLPGETMP